MISEVWFSIYIFIYMCVLYINIYIYDGGWVMVLCKYLHKCVIDEFNKGSRSPLVQL